LFVLICSSSSNHKTSRCTLIAIKLRAGRAASFSGDIGHVHDFSAASRHRGTGLVRLLDGSTHRDD
jgi:hypothetical protein